MNTERKLAALAAHDEATQALHAQIQECGEKGKVQAITPCRIDRREVMDRLRAGRTAIVCNEKAQAQQIIDRLLADL